MIGAVMCYATGIMGYVSFRGATEGNILKNFSGTLVSFFKLLFVLHVIMLLPNEVLRATLIRSARVGEGKGTHGIVRYACFIHVCTLTRGMHMYWFVKQCRLSTVADSIQVFSFVLSSATALLFMNLPWPLRSYRVFDRTITCLLTCARPNNSAKIARCDIEILEIAAKFTVYTTGDRKLGMRTLVRAVVDDQRPDARPILEYEWHSYSQ